MSTGRPSRRDSRQLAAQAFGAVAPALSSVAQMVVEERMARRRLEAETEMEKEMIEARAQSESQPAPSDRDSDGHGGSAIAELKADEDCEMCRRLLSGLDGLDDDVRQGKGLAEYGRFKRAVDRAEDVSEVEDELEDLPVLKSVLEEAFTQPATEGGSDE